MAEHDGLPTGDSKVKGTDESPVAPCRGWVEDCEFCDKRFTAWVAFDEEVMDKIPDKPGAFMIALKNKNETEVVMLLLNMINVQPQAHESIEAIKEQIADKRSKSSKATIMLRWMVMKKGDDKDVCVLCAHWHNNGVLPKFMTKWPGLDMLKRSTNLVFSDALQKWCYPKKNPTWRKPKPPSSKVVEVVEKCDWFQSCEMCESTFSAWKTVSDVVRNDLAPNEFGIFVVSVLCGKKREVVYIAYDEKDIKVNLKSTIKSRHGWIETIAKNKKFVNQNPKMQVRWALLKDVDTDNCCFLYAHWLNVDTQPMLSVSRPGEEILAKNKHFVKRENDKKWCYEIETLKIPKFSKAKNKKYLLQEMEDMYLEGSN
ncbi:uncharacterized protein LOC129234653 [Uloborus diversus]|uniref:uncharacterized protein LOC129234653 n=1 Tax=Uloborus diversus TaxID=327109 RepID=UPI002409F319|nr:uncharacterized protein LOC129234653 [Uloborus diversus]